MIHYVLLILFIGSDGVTSQSIPMNDKVTCEVAAIQLEAKEDTYSAVNHIYTICLATNGGVQ